MKKNLLCSKVSSVIHPEDKNQPAFVFDAIAQYRLWEDRLVAVWLFRANSKKNGSRLGGGAVREAKKILQCSSMNAN